VERWVWETWNRLPVLPTEDPRPVRSYFARYWSTDGKTMIGGVLESFSSRFADRADAVARLDDVKEYNRGHVDGEIRESKLYPEIFIHCGAGPAQALGGHCFGCKKLLQILDAKAAGKVGK
jgi:hypothetical protein